jgi:hypothetical protein
MKYFIQQPVQLMPRLFEGGKCGRRGTWLNSFQEETRMRMKILKQLYLDIQSGKCFYNPLVNSLATRSQNKKLLVLA